MSISTQRKNFVIYNTWRVEGAVFTIWRMKIVKFYKVGAVAVMSALFLSACATGPGTKAWYDQWGACAAGGA